MSRRIVFAVEAQDDLDNLYRYISKQSGALRANGFVTDIQDYCDGLVRFPFRGQRRDDVGAGLLTTSFRGRVVIAYHVDDSRVTIDRIFYGGRDIDTAFLD